VILELVVKEKGEAQMKWILLLALVIGTILLSTCDSSTPTTTEGKIESSIRKELGSSNREKIDKVKNISISESTSGDYVIAIDFAIDDNLTESLIKGGAKMDVYDVMKTLYAKYTIESIDMFGSFSMRDKYGNISEDVVLKCKLTKSTAYKINWENIYQDDLFKILDYLWWHPAFEAID
jgi:hypothetical protein